MSSGAVLQIIVFALMLGVAINLAGDKGKPVAVVFESFAEIMYKMTHMVTRLRTILSYYSAIYIWNYAYHNKEMSYGTQQGAISKRAQRAGI